VPSCGTGRPYASISYTRLMMPGDSASDFPIDFMLWIDKRLFFLTLVNELIDFLIRKDICAYFLNVETTLSGLISLFLSNVSCLDIYSDENLIFSMP
jgi:hypothetical protein